MGKRCHLAQKRCHESRPCPKMSAAMSVQMLVWGMTLYGNSHSKRKGGKERKPKRRSEDRLEAQNGFPSGND